METSLSKGEHVKQSINIEEDHSYVGWSKVHLLMDFLRRKKLRIHLLIEN